MSVSVLLGGELKDGLVDQLQKSVPKLFRSLGHLMAVKTSI